jgi:glucose/arabinose dehydrogenase
VGRANLLPIVKTNNVLYRFNVRTKVILWGLLVVAAQASFGQITNMPQLVDPKLQVRAVVTNLAQPTSMAFLRHNDLLVLEKASGQVKRIINGSLDSTVLDLAVNSASERGLLGIALHPRFPQNPGVYLYWTESLSGADSADLADVPLLGNRVDRFRWTGSMLVHETNIIQLRAFQEDAGQPLRGNHDGGIIRFGKDRKLYVYIGDVGRRGQMQNLPDGPGPMGNQPDDQFGGPEPDNEHLTGVILRLNDDGTTPGDNPFFRAGASRGGEAGANLQKVFAFGIRNGFGMAFDPFTGNLWEAQNGDDSFTEINRVEKGANLGWVQVMGPLERLDQFKEIETSSNFFGLQQIRWSPTNIADSEQDAINRMFWVFDDGNVFRATLTGREEVPPVTTDGSASAVFRLRDDGSIAYELRATGPLVGVTQAHIHLGGYIQNGPVVAFLLPLHSEGTNFERGDLIARGSLVDSNVIARPGFEPSISNLVQRLRQGRAYANIHTTNNQGGEVRGQIRVVDRKPVSHYSDPEFSWKFEVAPAGIGFVASDDLGKQYEGDMIVGAARDTLQGGTLFRFQLDNRGRGHDKKSHDGNSGRGDDDDGDDDDNNKGRGDDRDNRGKGHGNRREIVVSDPRLFDGVADNLAKFEITESESLLFGTGFGVGTDVHTGPNGNLFVVSLTHGTIYEIFRQRSFWRKDRD